MPSRSSHVGKALEVSSSIKGCPLGKVPIHKKTIGYQMSTNSSKESHVEDFHQYSQSYPGHHVSHYVLLIYLTLEILCFKGYHYIVLIEILL